MARFRLVPKRSLGDIMTSDEMEGVLNELLDKVEANASRDPNKKYVNSFRRQMWFSPSKGPRVAARKVGQFGAEPRVGLAVEAARGTMARALRESI